MARDCRAQLNHRKPRWLWALALLLAAVLTLTAAGYCALQARAADEDPLYALTFVSGTADASTDLRSQISFIRVKYTAADGSGTHYEVLYPEADYEESVQLAMTEGDGDHWYTQARRLENLGYSMNPEDVLFPEYGETTLLFTTLREASSIDGVEFYARGSGTWNCQNIQIYQVENKEMRLNLCAGQTLRYSIDFSGTLLLELNKGTAFSWTGSTLITPTLQTPAGAASRTMDGSEYILRMDIGDIYGGGMEANAAEENLSLYEQGFCEELALRLRYRDQYGSTRVATVPMVIGTLEDALESGEGTISTALLAGVGQDGDTLACKVHLPEFSALLSADVIYSNEEAMTVAGLEANVEFAGRYKLLARESDAQGNAGETLSVAGISLYSAGDTAVSYTVSDMFLRTTVTGNPLYYYRAASAAGTEVAYGAAANVTFQQYETGANLLPVNQTERYLVALKTDTPSSAGTTGSLRMKLKYVDVEGSQRESNPLVLSEQCLSYYGYWPVDNAYALSYYGLSESQVPYLSNVRAGGTLYFLVELNNVDYFNGAELTLDSSDDNWQMAGLCIYSVEKLGQRAAAEEDSGWTNTERVYSRTGNEVTQLLNIAQTVLLQPGETHTMDLRSDSTLVDDTDDDWSDIRYSMTYAQAKTLGSFTKTRQTYTIKVKVAGDLAADGDNGDCGSENQFYFQLVFEDGTSACVLANQQLAADGFRTGTEETFTISTNRDYGDVTAVRIIPEDLDSKSDVFDKLKIDTITVRKDGTDAVTRQWVISEVGWIDIDYRDEGEDAGGRQARTMDELARTFSVSYSTDVVNVQVSMVTDAYNRGDPQLQGEVTGVLTYRDTSGQTQEETIDLVKSMYTYIDQTPSAASSTDYMFRENHTDRFFVSLENPSEIISLKLNVTGSSTTTWNIKEVSVKLAGQNSSLQININDEYEWVDSGETVNICEQQSTTIPAYSLVCTAGATQSITVPFTENQISVEDGSTGKTVSAVSRTPQSSDDTLNVYVYMAENADSTGDFTLKAAAQYTKVYGGIYQSSATLAVSGSNSRMLYAKGLSASYLSTLNSLYLKAEATTSPTYTGDYLSAILDYAIVQRVRAGVIVETYYFDFGNNNASYGVTMRPGAVPSADQQEQVVTLSFGADTSELQLFSENYDVAVALRYTCTVDPTGTTYRSPYIYLTDQQINSIKAGQIVDLTFDEPYVGEITGLTLTTSVDSNTRAVQRGEAAAVKINVDSAVVATYQVQTQSVQAEDGTTTEQTSRTCTGWYSFADAITLNNSEQTMYRTSATDSGIGTVSQLSLKLVTAEAEAGSNSGYSGAIAMTVGYTNPSGVSHEIYYEDIRPYLTSGDFSDGSTATLRFQLDNISEVRWISFTPKSNDGTNSGSWKLASLSGTLKTGDRENTFARAVDRVFNETDDGKINVNIQVNLVAQTTSKTSGNVTTKKASNSTNSLLAESGQPVTITVTVLGSDESFEVTAEEYSVETDAGKNVSSYVSIRGSVITFNAPANYTGANINYRVIVSSKEVPSLQSVINITVQYTDKPAERTTVVTTPTESTPAASTPTESTPTESAPAASTPAESAQPSASASAEIQVTTQTAETAESGETGDTGT